MVNGRLPDQGPVRLAPVALPTGRLVTGNGGDHVAWATVDPVPESRRIWAARSELHPQTGLVPVQLDGLRPAVELTQVEQASVSLAVAEAPEPGRCDQRAHDCLFFAGEALNRSGGPARLMQALDAWESESPLTLYVPELKAGGQ